LLQQRFNQNGAGAVSRSIQMVGKQPGAAKSSRSPNPPIVWRFFFHRRLKTAKARKSCCSLTLKHRAQTLPPNTYQVAPSQVRFTQRTISLPSRIGPNATGIPIWCSIEGRQKGVNSLENQF